MTLSFDIANLSGLYAASDATPQDVVRELFRRIREIGERPIWITLRSESDVLASLDAAPKGPLYGIPFAVKDNIDVAGLPTTCACPAYSYTPEHSAYVVDRLVAAGAIVIGKTNMDQFATGLVGTRSPYGIPSSPFNTDYISGGSSSGSAVAVSRGLVSFALGTDTAGSGRVPAAFNNIIGLKPTKGWISTRGVVPACRSQDTVSIFALTCGDASSVMSIAASYDADDDYARLPPHPYHAHLVRSRVRVGVPRLGLEFFGDDAAEVLFRGAVCNIAALGADIIDVDFTPFAEAAKLLYSGPWVAERAAAVGDFVDAHASDIDSTVRSIIQGARTQSAVDTFEGFYSLARMCRQAEKIWDTIDVLLVPTTGTTYRIADVLADPIQLNSNLGRTTNFVNLMDLSAFAVPAGFRENGLPFGVTLIGRAFDDGYLTALGDKLHRSLSGAALGATTTALASVAPIVATERCNDLISIAVVGAHLSGQPLNVQLQERKARLVRTARTSSGYSFYALPHTSPPKPGLIFDGHGKGNIEVEIWEMSADAFGSFVSLIPAPLGIGTLKLDDGSTVQGFLCEAHAIVGALDITSFGGWRAWLASR
ncbi:MAG: allophanate hydrolase [Hyphomicrobium sp.]|nr:MAG: allophanate hydrolase [Hyphomicrobium sp.]